jgi:CRP/FNR family transcriptional regulator, anaerobic regulatory protein
MLMAAAVTREESSAAVVPLVCAPPRHHLHLVAQPTSDCERCALGAVCVPEGLAADERREFTSLVFRHRRLRAGERLFRAGDAFSHLYFVKTGAFKTVVLLDDGREQVTGFHFAGDVLGIDAISSPAHPSEALALADTHVCAIPFAALTRLSRRAEHLQTWLQRLLAREVVRDQGVMLLLGRMHADERVAAFLLNLSNRFRARGLSPLEFSLPMAREDIGNYLGLTLETVSRCFSRLKNAGVIDVEIRHIRVLDLEALQAMVGGARRPVQ